jgi:hypothetical protein
MLLIILVNNISGAQPRQMPIEFMSKAIGESVVQVVPSKVNFPPSSLFQCQFGIEPLILVSETIYL